jgi:iron complex transport system substrate-binding protein
MTMFRFRTQTVLWGLSPLRGLCSGMGHFVLLLLLAVATISAQIRPTRIISVVPAATEILFAIGAGPRVVAVSSFDHEPPEVNQLPRVGALMDPDVERILSLKPDLIVIYGSQHDLAQQMSRAGIAQFAFVHGGLADVLTTITALGERTDTRAAASHLATTIRSQLDAIRARVAGRSRPRTLIVFGRDPGTLRNLFASGGIGFLHEMVEAAGGADVFADVKRESVQATSETLIARAPEVVIEIRAGDETVPNPDDWNALPSIPAVQHHRVSVLVGTELVTAGPRVGIATERMARAIHPEAF